MKSRVMAASGVAAIAMLVAGSTSAFAATEFGDPCAANTASTGATFTPLAASGNPLPLTAPTGGVITKVKINLGVPVPFTIPTKVKLIRDLGGDTFLVTQQAEISVGGGLTTADVRFPVQAGERLATRGSRFKFEGSEAELTLLCGGVEGTAGLTNADPGPGQSAKFEPAAGIRVPVTAVIEPDADNDGFGDETQDKCPQSAAVNQVECPAIVLDAYAVPDKGKAIVIVAANVPGPVTVSGSVKLPKTAKASASAKLKKVTRTVAPGQLGRFTLRYPGSLKSALSSLPPGKKLKLKISASATNAAGQVSTDKTTLKLAR